MFLTEFHQIIFLPFSLEKCVECLLAWTSMNLDIDAGCRLEGSHAVLLNAWENFIPGFPSIWICFHIAMKSIPIFSFAVIF